MLSPTLKDVARAAGVSKSTAQRALAGDPRCAQETRDSVQKIAREVGYRPSPIFSCMGSRNEHKRLDQVPVAYLDFLTKADKSSGMSYFPFVEKRALELGYHLKEFDVRLWDRPEQIWKILYSQGFVGVVLGRVWQRDMPLLLQNELFPVVCCGRLDALPWHTVRSGVVESTHRIFKKLIALGYRKIGVAACRHTPVLEDDFSRHAAVLAAQREIGQEIKSCPPFLGEPRDLKGFMEWFEKNQPEVVVGFHIGQYYGILEAGYRIPEDIGYVTLHSAGIAEHTNQLICGYNQSDSVIGECAMNLLDLLVRHGERGLPRNAQNVLIEPSWSDGDTLRNLSQ